MRQSARPVPVRRTNNTLPAPRRVPIAVNDQASEEPDLAATLFPSPPSAKRKALGKQGSARTRTQIQHNTHEDDGEGWGNHRADMDAETRYGGPGEAHVKDWQTDAATCALPVASTSRAVMPSVRAVRTKERALSQINRPRQQQQQHIISIDDDDEDGGDDDDIEEVEPQQASTSRDKGKGRVRAESPIAGDIKISELPSPIRKGYYKMLNLDEDGRPNAEVDTERVAKGSALNTAWKGKLPQERYRAGTAASGAAKKSWGTGRKGGGRKKSFVTKGSGRGRTKKK